MVRAVGPREDRARRRRRGRCSRRRSSLRRRTSDLRRRTVPSRERARGHDDHRGLDAGARRRRPARGPLRPRGDVSSILDTLVLRFAAWRDHRRRGGRPDRLVGPDAAVPRADRLVVPRRSASGLPALRAARAEPAALARRARRRFHVEISDLAFAARLRREPELRPRSTRGSQATTDALEWEQRKHERLLAA